ncbi:MAG: hypothetical protein M1537_03590 [Nitrospirae bacterium]|nr:hypothetical protein [Nitrospirota bacterium]
MLGRDQCPGRKIQDLSRIDGQAVFLFEGAGVPAGAALRQMDENPARHLDRRESLSGMPLLSSRLPVRGRAKTLG